LSPRPAPFFLPPIVIGAVSELAGAPPVILGQRALRLAVPLAG